VTWGGPREKRETDESDSGKQSQSRADNLWHILPPKKQEPINCIVKSINTRRGTLQKGRGKKNKGKSIFVEEETTKEGE